MKPIERMIPVNDDNPGLYRVSCSLCSYVDFYEKELDANGAWKIHKKESGHDVGYIRGPRSKSA